MNARIVKTLDATMYFVEEGTGDPIVFLHGNPTSSFLWRNVMPRLAGEGHLFAPDLIGMGKSARPDIPYRFFDHARYLDAWFDALRIERATLVVHDWGAALGIDWAKRHPARVVAIAIMEGVLRPIPWEDFPESLVETFRGFRTPGVGEKLVLEENVFVEKVLPAAILRRLSDEEMNAYREPFPDPRSRRAVLAWPRDLPLGGEPADVVALLAENEDWLESSETPKLLLTFEPGGLVTAKVAAWCAETFRNLEVRKIGPGIHYVQEDHPEAIGDAVKEWRRAATNRKR